MAHFYTLSSVHFCLHLALPPYREVWNEFFLNIVNVCIASDPSPICILSAINLSLLRVDVFYGQPALMEIILGCAAGFINQQFSRNLPRVAQNNNNAYEVKSQVEAFMRKSKLTWTQSKKDKIVFCQLPKISTKQFAKY